MVAERSHIRGNDKVNAAADDRAGEQERAAADAVDEWKDRPRSNEEDDVLDDGGIEA